MTIYVIGHLMVSIGDREKTEFEAVLSYLRRKAKRDGSPWYATSFLFHLKPARLPCLPREFYVTMVKWATTTKLAINWLNRAQNISVLTLCEATTGVCTKVRPPGWALKDRVRVLWSGERVWVVLPPVCRIVLYPSPYCI